MKEFIEKLKEYQEEKMALDEVIRKLEEEDKDKIKKLIDDFVKGNLKVDEAALDQGSELK